MKTKAPPKTFPHGEGGPPQRWMRGVAGVSCRKYARSKGAVRKVCRCEPVTDVTGVAAPRLDGNSLVLRPRCLKIRGIATPACALVRNDRAFSNSPFDCLFLTAPAQNAPPQSGLTPCQLPRRGSFFPNLPPRGRGTAAIGGGGRGALRERAVGNTRVLRLPCKGSWLGAAETEGFRFFLEKPPLEAEKRPGYAENPVILLRRGLAAGQAGTPQSAALTAPLAGEPERVFSDCSRPLCPSSVSLTRASTTFYGISATGSYVRFISLRDAPPGGEAL